MSEMKKRLYIVCAGLLVLALLLLVLYFLLSDDSLQINDYDLANAAVRVYPDYTSIAIPPNIAPLNFQIKNPGKYYYVRIYSNNGKAIHVRSRKGIIKIPHKRWANLLQKNIGAELKYDVFIQDQTGRWIKYETITNTIARDSIDPYLVYRKIDICQGWNIMGIYQRDLTGFDESIVIHNKSYGYGCANCHCFLNNNPDTMVLQVRSPAYGTPMLMGRQGQVNAVNTKTAVTPGKCGFTAIHPNGKIIAFTLNKFSMLTHLAGDEVREVFDHAADLALYLVDDNQVLSTSKITKPDRIETFPAWSPDGKYLYFCSATQFPPEKYNEVLCDLMRISYDPKTNKWGDLETVLPARKINRSFTQPRFSPNGKYILLSVSDYSDFPIHMVKSDLYLLESATGECRKMSISSDRNDSWHGFSSNGRWIVFNSKRMDGRFSRPFFSYFDKSGRAHKPFVMPQMDPTFYRSLTRVYNVPELIIKPIDISQRNFASSIIGYKKTTSEAKAITGATPGMQLPSSSEDVQQTETPWTDPYARE
jgi:Tol biopolymer transport system component